MREQEREIERERKKKKKNGLLESTQCFQVKYAILSKSNENLRSKYLSHLVHKAVP